jgi:hypothetical protein
VEHSKWLGRPISLLFAAKIILMLLACIWIIRYFLNAILLRSVRGERLLAGGSNVRADPEIRGKDGAG